MAAAGGGLTASVVFAGVNPSAPARCRFPGRPWRPWPCRSRQKTVRRSRVGRLGLEAAAGPREPRPDNVELTLREDPSLLRVLRLSERLARQKEAGFCTSGSDEVSYKYNESLLLLFFVFLCTCLPRDALVSFVAS